MCLDHPAGRSDGAIHRTDEGRSRSSRPAPAAYAPVPTHVRGHTLSHTVLEDGSIIHPPAGSVGTIKGLAAPLEGRRAAARVLAMAAARARALPAPVWWAGAFVPFVLLAVLPRLPGPGVGADDYGQYLMHAQALATGQPYGHINYLYTSLNQFIGPANALPGLPLLLAPVLRLGGVGLVPWVMLLVALVFPLLGGIYFLRHGEPRLALLTALLSVLSPAIVFSATQALTDLPFAATLWGLALVADQPGRMGWGRILAVTALGGAALLLRTAAVAIIPALLITAVVRRRSGGLGMALPVLIWMALGAIAVSFMELSRVLLVRLDLGQTLWWAVSSGRMRVNSVGYALAMLDAHFPALPGGKLSLALRLVALGLTFLGTIAWLRRHPDSFVAIFALAYGAMLLVLPFQDARYLWPLLPLTAYGLLEGVRIVVQRFGRERRALGAAIVTGVLLAVLGAMSTALTRRPVALADTPDGHQLIQYLGELAGREPVRLTFMKPRMLAWTLHIPVMGTFRATAPATLDELCAKRITHVVTSLVSREHDGPLRALADARSDLFSLTFANHTYRVYRFSGGCPLAPAGARAGVASR